MGVKYYGQAMYCVIKTSLHTLIMAGEHVLKFALLFAFFITHVFTAPCGTNLDCKCWQEARIVSCANRGLTEVPQVSSYYRNHATILVLDGNQLTWLKGLNLDEWPSLISLWIRTNPTMLCTTIEAFKRRFAGRSIDIVADCMSGDAVGIPRVDEEEEEGEVEEVGGYYDNNNAEVGDDSQGPQLPLPLPTYTRSMMLEELMPTTQRDNHVIVYADTTTDSNYTETTEQEQGSMTVGVAFDMNGIVVTITVPLMFLGIAAVIIRIAWRRRQARQLEFDIEMRPTNPRTHLKNSPTPSEGSTTSTSSMAIFDAECDRRRHDTRANRRLAMLASRGSE